MSLRILHGDCRELLRTLPDESVHCVVTSPPYFGLRDYGLAAQIGLEPTPEGYVAEVVSVFREVRRVLRNDGTCWLNLGDSFSNKQLLGIPWRVAFALQADGWWLRQDIIWSKPNPMPESVTDRCTKAHEYLFLLTKNTRYYFDAAAIAEPVTQSTIDRVSQSTLEQQAGSYRVPGKTNGPMKAVDHGRTRNKRSVWEITTQPFSEEHFATFPPALIEPCILAGCPKDGTVLDPFFGAGTTGLVADRLHRNCIGIELNPEYMRMGTQRIKDDAPLFVSIS